MTATIETVELIDTFDLLGITHVVWLPDAFTGRWEKDLASASNISLVRVCREGEAWAIAAGLWLGGMRPVLMIQNTGLFESGDALRNVLFELEAPLYAIIGYRNYLVPESRDTAKRFTEPILQAWQLDYIVLNNSDWSQQLSGHFQACQSARRPGIALLPEGRLNEGEHQPIMLLKLLRCSAATKGEPVGVSPRLIRFVARPGADAHRLAI